MQNMVSMLNFCERVSSGNLNYLKDHIHVSEFLGITQPFFFFCSISSTIMDVDSTISSGRSTPAMMNGQGSTTSSSKNIAYNCCWDQCQACFNSSPDLADHIRSIHVDGQRGGVGFVISFFFIPCSH